MAQNKNKQKGKKEGAKPGRKAIRHAKRERSVAKLKAKRDRHVKKSSHGAYSTVAEMEAAGKAHTVEREKQWREAVKAQQAAHKTAAELMGKKSLREVPHAD